jgi:hypothetical protein
MGRPPFAEMTVHVTMPPDGILAEALETTRLYRVTGRTGARMAFAIAYPPSV